MHFEFINFMIQLNSKYKHMYLPFGAQSSIPYHLIFNKIEPAGQHRHMCISSHTLTKWIFLTVIFIKLTIQNKFCNSYKHV